MPKGTFLIIEKEPPEALSTRKLVLETAHHNVITAYSGEEGLRLLRRFPKVDAVVLHSQLGDVSCEQVAESVKRQDPKLPLIVIAPGENYHCGGADQVLSSHDPQALLNVLNEIVAA